MAYYEVGAPGFMADLSAIFQRYRAPIAQLAVAKFPEEVLSYYWYPRHDQGWAKACVVANGWLDLRYYPRELLAVAEGWGLRCDWAAPWLHACLVEHLYPDLPSSEELSLIPMNLNTDLDSAFESVRGEDIICLKVRYKPTPPMVLRDPSHDLATIDWKRDFIKVREKTAAEAIKQLNEQMDEIDRKYLGRGYRLRDAEPALSRHIHWLYLHICPQPDIGRPWGWQKIADTFGIPSKTSVRNPVLALAREMGITLPDLPPGQPARFT